ncbi:hypothetical protein EBME_0639 [bacterium endosymbiont of Mortierella elongata FMR23-6]|nr:hypothetical protein EBME_0639 [bacterium endosymbiont of Mortierella elongata FMR23-6]
MNPSETKMYQTLAEINLDYGCLLEKQRKSAEAGNAYQEAKRYGLDAYQLEPHQPEIQILLQNIGLSYS